MNFKVTLFLLLMLTHFGVSAQISLSEINLSYQYENDSEKEYDADIYGMKENGQMIIFASYKIPDTLKTLPVSFWGANTYKEPVKRIDSLVTLERYLGQHQDRHIYEYRFNSDYKIFALELVSGSNVSQVYDLFFDDQKYPVTLFTFDDQLPLMNRWVVPGKSYFTEDLKDSNLEQYVSFFDYDFEPAVPPMSTKIVETKELKEDSLFLVFENTEVDFTKRGFYLFQDDTSSTTGFGWRLENNVYPDLNRIEHLIPPLRYITTGEEYAALTSAMSKKAFDSFWLKLGRSEQATRGMISKYYNRVKGANKFFTSYKEGWKTDRGMVYIVYGPPHQVVRTADGEIWSYFVNNVPQTFTFARFSHTFYPYNYVLVRDEKYRRSWFTAVDLLRNNNF